MNRASFDIVTHLLINWPHKWLLTSGSQKLHSYLWSCQFSRLHVGQTDPLFTRLCAVLWNNEVGRLGRVVAAHWSRSIWHTLIVWLSGQGWWLLQGFMQSEEFESKGNMIFAAQKVDGDWYWENEVQCSLCYIPDFSKQGGMLAVSTRFHRGFHVFTHLHFHI